MIGPSILDEGGWVVVALAQMRLRHVAVESFLPLAVAAVAVLALALLRRWPVVWLSRVVAVAVLRL